MRLRFLIIQILTLSLCLSARGQVPFDDFDYFGVEPPGLEAKRFNPQISGLEGRQMLSIHFTPDGNECYFIMQSDDTRKVYLRTKNDGTWSEPRPVEFPDGGTSIHGFSPDGSRLYFSAQTSDNFEQSGVYVRTRTADGWSSAERLPEPVNQDHANRVIGLTVGASEDLYFCTWRQPCLGQCDVWCAKYVDGTFPAAENLRILNTSTSECTVICGLKDSFLVFYSWRPGGFGQADLYVGFRDGDTWTVPKNLGPHVNTNQGEVPQTMSPDGKYMFFYSSGNLHWIETRAVLPVPNGPIENLTSRQQFDSIQAAVNLANSGDEIVLAPGIYRENIDLTGKNIVLRSTDPGDPNLAEQTILTGDSIRPVITLNNNTNACRIAGLTIRDGSIGIYCNGGNPLIEACNIKQNIECGLELLNRAEPSISNCIVAANQGEGIKNLTQPGRNLSAAPKPLIKNCTIVQNDSDAISGVAAVRNSILYFNNEDSNGHQITPDSVIASYCDVQGGYDGVGNIDADPLFVALGYLINVNDPNATWIDGDYHLQLDSACIDTGDPADPVGGEPQPNGNIINMGAYGGTVQAAKTKEYVRFLWSTPAVFRTPESVTYDGKRDVLYVSNFNIRGGFLQSGDNSFDEFISKVNTNGEIEQLEWVTGLNGPTGMSVFEDTLYVVERDCLVEIDIEAGQIVNRYTIPQAGFLNDVVFDSNGIGYLTDNNQNSTVSIYRFIDGKLEPWINSSQMSRTNGLCLDRDRLVGSDYNSTYLKGVRLSDGQIENMAYHGISGISFDGMRVVDENIYMASDFNSTIYLIFKAGFIKPIIDLSDMTPIAGQSVCCADIEYIPGKKLLVIPTFYDHRLLAYELLD